MRQFPTIMLTLGISAVLTGAKKEIDWKIGNVLDSNAAKTYVYSRASTNTAATSSTTSTSQTKIRTTVIQENQLLIAGDEYAYLISDPVAKPVGLPTHGIVTRAITNHGHGCRFIVGESIRYAQDKSTLHVIDVDGKECKLDILRQERLK